MTFEEIINSMNFELKPFNNEHLQIIKSQCDKYWSTFNLDKKISYIERQNQFRQLVIKNVNEKIDSTDDYTGILELIIALYSYKIKEY